MALIATIGSRVSPTRRGACAVLLVLLGAPSGVQAHHSYSEYDQASTVEIEGKLTEFRWVNPHPIIKVLAGDGTGAAVMWNVESNLGGESLRRRGVSPQTLESFRIGDTVKIAGWPSKRSGDRLFATNLLAGDGLELVTWRYSEPRWSRGAINPYATAANGEGVVDVAPASRTLFRVWSAKSSFNEADLARLGQWEAARRSRVFPLTPRAKELLGDPNFVAALDAQGCRPKGMPLIMTNPYPIELVDNGDTIALRIEMYDLERTIHMRGAADPSTQPRSLLGYSTGKWDGETLVVNTSRIDYAALEFGVPQSPSAELVERFTPSTDGRLLEHLIEATDPEYLTEPVELTSAFPREWVPGEKVMRYNCVAGD